MGYQEAVDEGRKLVKRSEEDQWRLAQLTWEQLEGGVKAAQWANDIGVSNSYAYRLYKMWQRQSDSDDVHKPKFSEAYNDVSPASQYQPRHPEPEAHPPEHHHKDVPEEDSPLNAFDVMGTIAAIQDDISFLHDHVKEITRPDDVATKLERVIVQLNGLIEVLRDPSSGVVPDWFPSSQDIILWLEAQPASDTTPDCMRSRRRRRMPAGSRTISTHSRFRPNCTRIRS